MRALPVLLAAALLAWGCSHADGVPGYEDEAVVWTLDGPEPLQPTGFSWLLEDDLAGLAFPGYGDTLAARTAWLADHEITLLVSLTVTSADPLIVHDGGLELLHLPIHDFTAPSMDQIEAYVLAVDEVLGEGGAVAVHCGAGLGRTGTMLAAWLVATGMTAEDAIAAVRAARPGSIETQSQIQALHAYEILVAATP